MECSCSVPKLSSYRKVTVPREGKVIVYSGKTVVPGELLGILGTSVKNRSGTWIEKERVIRSSFLGIVTVTPRHDENEKRIDITVSRPSASPLDSSLLPSIGETVLAEILSVDILEVSCRIRVVGGQVLEHPVMAVMRMENIEPLNPHLIELEDHFASKDLILARVLTLDSPVQLDVASDSKLGVVMAFTPAGVQMIPIGPHEVICPETFRKAQRRLSTAVFPVAILPRKGK